MSKWLAVLLVVATVAFGVGRAFVTGGHPLSLPGSYQAFAHLFVGGLIGAWIVCRDRLLLGMAAGLIAVELLAFGLKTFAR